MFRLIKLISVAVFYVLFIAVATIELTRPELNGAEHQNRTFDLLIRDVVESQIVTMVRYEFAKDKFIPNSERVKSIEAKN